jgi:DNA-binding SARP family transcriptional activator
VQLFGALRVEFAGTPLALPAPPSARSVLAWLLAHPGSHARARVAGQFRPEVVDRAARASLRTALWEIRRAAGAERSAPWLSQSRDRVGVAAERIQELDLDTFRDGVAAGSSDGLRRALELARPRLLTDLADDWVLELRDEVHDLAVGAAAQLAERAEAAGDHASAIQWTRRAVREAPLDEQVHRLLMLRLADAGERAEALMVFDRLEAALMADVGVAPSPATIELAHRLAGRRPTSAPGRVIEESALCRAPALEVMKLLQDPLRYREWWEGLTDAQPTADGLTRWMGAVPGTPIPTRIDLRRAAGGVVLRCEVTGIVHVWMLEPARGGCRVRLRAAVPAQEAGRWLKQQRAEVRASLPRLVAAAERAAGLPGSR